MSVRSLFGLAVIDVGLPEISGIDLTVLAANENTPVLLALDPVPMHCLSPEPAGDIN
jgi:hypothetical protein